MRQHSSMGTSQWFLTAAATTAALSPLSNFSSLGTPPTCARLFATSATSSHQDDCTPWARAPDLASCCPTSESAAHPATWQRPSACRLCSAVRAGLRTGCVGPCSGLWWFTRRFVSAGTLGDLIAHLCLQSFILIWFDWGFQSWSVYFHLLWLPKLKKVIT